jgi:hypothetical protein
MIYLFIDNYVTQLSYFIMHLIKLTVETKILNKQQHAEVERTIVQVISRYASHSYTLRKV